ncbi:MAG TPA: Ppx/GppA family phosphatase [Alphaproteobacteria bacterium]|nr:Ppx/GppA family phosphatase [Alphaproteobacteria bacterium]
MSASRSASPAERAAAAARRGRLAVVDIGSNSIRLVVFDGLKRAPFPLFNEKVMCGLGRGLERSGELNADGVVMALDNLGRFVTLAGVMGAERIDLLATAAVRDASNGAEFVRKVEKACGRRVRVLSGEEEAHLSAMGVLMGMPQATGVMGDLGGGSLELVAVERGKLGAHATLPLGPLRLAEAAGEDMGKAAAIVDAALEPLAWLRDLKGEAFYPVGGAWRTLARIHMEQSAYPLHVIQEYRVARRDMEDMARLVAGMGRKSLARLVDVARRRLEALPYAALVMERVLRATRPATVTFSAAGLREGHVYGLLPAGERNRDPLLAMCEDIAEDLGRFGSPGAALEEWTRPLFPKETPAENRLRRAACELSDIVWREHPDYRAEQAFEQPLYLPLFGIDHPGRCYLALALFARYGGDGEEGAERLPRGLLDAEAAERAVALGLAMRLAYALTGAAPELLTHSRLDLQEDRVALVLEPDWRMLAGDAVARRLDALGKALKRETKITV